MARWKFTLTRSGHLPAPEVMAREIVEA